MRRNHAFPYKVVREISKEEELENRIVTALTTYIGLEAIGLDGSVMEKELESINVELKKVCERLEDKGLSNRRVFFRMRKLRYVSFQNAIPYFDIRKAIAGKRVVEETIVTRTKRV